MSVLTILTMVLVVVDTDSRRRASLARAIRLNAEREQRLAARGEPR